MRAMGVWKLFQRVLGSLWRVLDGVRKTLHLIVLLVLVIIVLASLASERSQVPRDAALVIAPQGVLVEQLSGDPLDRALAKARGIPLQETLLKDLIAAIREAKDDERITTLVLQLDELTGGGLSKLQELADEIVLFRDSGKAVIAVGDSFTRNQYYLAAHADEVYMHPMGFVFIDGYSRFQPYFKSALDKLYVDFHVWTVGEYKSFVEPFTRDDMSDEDRESSEAFLGALWEAYQADVTAARELGSDALQSYADDAVALLSEAGGDMGQLAVSYGLVDELLTRDRVRERLKERVGAEENDDEHSYPRIDHEAYLRATRDSRLAPSRDQKLAVVVAAGTIFDGAQPPGSVGGDSTAQLVRRATEDEEVKALVLRVDSPGGSAFASDVILRELEVFQETERPLIVSMGSVAASGGYWISMGADEIWASPTTLTGSIGVGAMFPTFTRSLDQIGVHVDGVGTTTLAGQLNPTRELGADAAELLNQSIQFIYAEFIRRVAEHRGREVEAVDRVARGRVWVASEAQEHGLVDRLGDLDDALISAAGLAGLAEGEYQIEYLEQELGFVQRIALQLVRTMAPIIGALDLEVSFSEGFRRLLEVAAEPLRLWDQWNDPRGLYAYCFCEAR